MGCGNGRFFDLFKGKNIDYFGIDSSKRLIEIAKNKHPTANFQVADGLNLPFSDSYFDKIYSIATLHHIPSREFRQQFLREIRRALKPGGIFILTVWNLWSKPKFRKIIFKFSALKIFRKSKLDFKDIIIPWQGMPWCYFHCFTKNELEKLVRKTGFRIRESGQIAVSQQKKPNSNFYIVAEK